METNANVSLVTFWKDRNLLNLKVMERVKEAIEKYFKARQEAESRNQQRVTRFMDLDGIVRDFFTKSNMSDRIVNGSKCQIQFGNKGITVRKDNNTLSPQRINDEMYEEIITSIIRIIETATQIL